MYFAFVFISHVLSHMVIYVQLFICKALFFPHCKYLIDSVCFRRTSKAAPNFDKQECRLLI